MSIVKITHHNETIFDIELPDEKEIFAEKPIRYRSKFSKAICDAEKRLKNQRHMQHKTFGLPDESSTLTPDKYLKRDEGIRRHYDDRPKTTSTKCTSRLPAVPKHNEINKTASMQSLCQKEKNFKLINMKRAKSAILRYTSGPKCFEQTPPSFIHLSKYGNVPKYLMRMNEEMKRLREMNLKEKQEAENEERNKNIRFITLDEKNKLLEGLKHNWHKMQEEYQKMPLLIDSVPKMIRKTKLENNLKSLERDLCLLNTNSSRIYIVPD